MAYSELIKNFNRIREYMREFYVYGFKSREQFTVGSARSYDNERRRVESWLGDCMSFRRSPDGKNVFFSIDSRAYYHNPLYKAWKAKSFTDGDITLHFILMDILSGGQDVLFSRIVEEVDDYLTQYGSDKMFDESTIRKKLKEYVECGIISMKKEGRSVSYRLCEASDTLSDEALDFFSEVAPLGVIGSYLLDKRKPHREITTFKHHYITGTMDSEVLCELFLCMGRKCFATLKTIDRRHGEEYLREIVPLKIMISAQSGRQYLLAYSAELGKITTYRLDNIAQVKAGEVCPEFDNYREELSRISDRIWGVSLKNRGSEELERVEFTLRYSDDEQFIYRRLLREKRVGRVERLDKNSARFSCEVYDSSELIPWIRTFICRIVDVHFSNQELEEQFRSDLLSMYEMYGVGDGE
ncbi:MAG: WYL domain-containing protein [Lachnospiraceae bacterium]|nr:WYL domain-containing protein [Lachnospiraceae bacterium]